MKKQIVDLSSLLFLSCFSSSISLLLVPGLADSSSTSDSSNNQNTASKKSSGSSTWLEVLLIFLGILAVGAFSVFLFKLWQRKKREEQHARLLKLFEQDDELEVELGLRD
ncbi:transmembrane protein [Perilla frutescens var. hirtella]|nr:transmembrane protein [Perilla frutescens var. frutescens]KAH6775127.1 transmembrane protein [Perilla frutescens var. hirtella]